MIDWNKPLQTKDGRKAEFVRKINNESPFCYMVIITDKDGIEWIGFYEESGQFRHNPDASLDLINPPPPKRKEVLNSPCIVLPFLTVESASRELRDIGWKGIVTTFQNHEIEVDQL